MNAEHILPPDTRRAPILKQLYIQNFGCQMNVYDGDRMRDLLQPLGYAKVDAPDDADLIILNTCHIREKATEKVYSELGRLRAHKERREGEGARTTIVVAGCVAQAEGEEIIAREASVDLVVGPQAYHKLPELIARTHRARGERVAADFEAMAKFDALPAPAAHGVTAFLSIQEGCDKFCTFCVVPYTRGAEFSRPVDSVLAEAAHLVSQGVRDITLLGQNVNAYHGRDGGKDADLAGLLRRLAGIEGLAQLRYATSHPAEMDDELIALHGEEPKLMPFLHLPVQSGSSRILKAMNRKHDREHYFRVVEKVRSARPDIALSTDFIVGYPGETDQDFEDTMSLIEAVGFASAYSFKFSRRPGTPAAAMHKQVDEAVKDQRLARLQARLYEQQTEFNRATIGRRMNVLVAGAGRMPGQLHGRSPFNQAVHFAAEGFPIGSIVPVRIIDASQNSITGELIS